MIRVGLIGVGKMGLSHYAILAAHPHVELVAICDSATYVTSALRKYTGVETFKDYRKMLDSTQLDCVAIATPTSAHFEAASDALERGLHVFVEKPLCLDPDESRKLAPWLLPVGRYAFPVFICYLGKFYSLFRNLQR